ncbi:MAG: hypothetical protein OES26_27325 [Gammaproteobacteria bacterium]|nr:hypothetical protein [Gammaproteobacteria bacterium]
MSKSVSAWLLTAAVFTALSATPSLSQDREFVGFSGLPQVPAGGVLNLHDACETAIPGSRMCRTGDILNNGTSLSALPTGFGWVQPTVLGVFFDGITANVVTDTGHSGILFGELTCRNWNSVSHNDFGMTIRILPSGVVGFSAQSCANTTIQVACCDLLKKK